MEKEKAFEQIEYLQELAEQSRLRAARGYPFFLLWGVLWVIGYLGTAIYSPTIWGIVGLTGGIGSIWISYRQVSKETAPLLLRKLKRLEGLLLLAALAIYFVLVNFIEVRQFFNAYWPFQIGVMYTAAGIFIGQRMIKIGLWLIGIAAIGFWLPEFWCEVWFAFLGGGGLLFTGWYFRKQVLEDE